MDRETDYRRELEELEGGNPGRSNVVTPFDEEEPARRFADQLQAVLGITVEVRYVQGSSGGSMPSPGYYDLQVPGSQLFRVKLLYRLFQRGVLADRIPSQPKALRTGHLRDALMGVAIQAGRWREDQVRPADLAWYATLAGLEQGDVERIRLEARQAFLARRRSEKGVAWWGGWGLLLGGAAVWWWGVPPLGLVGVGGGIALLIFSLTR